MWRRASRCRCRWTASSFTRGSGIHNVRRALRLWLEDLEEHLRVGSLVTWDAVQRAGDAQHLALEVDIVPAQSEDLALTHDEIQGHAHHRLKLGSAKASRIARASSGRTEAALVADTSRGSARAAALRATVPQRCASASAERRTARAWLTVRGARPPATACRIAMFTCCGVSCASLTLPKRGISWYLMRPPVPPAWWSGGCLSAADPGAEKVADGLPLGGRCHPDSKAPDCRVHLRDRIGAALAIQAAPDLATSHVEADGDARLPLPRTSLPDRPFAKPSAPARHPALQAPESVGGTVGVLACWRQLRW